MTIRSMRPGHRQYGDDSVNDGRFDDALERQISTLRYERLLSNSDLAPMEKEADDNVQSL